MTPRWPLCTMIACLLHTQPASALDCDRDSSPCIDANALWLPAAPTRLVSVSGPQPLRARRMSSGLAFEYLSRPIVAKSSSPAPEGREVPVLRNALIATWMWAFGIGRGVELSGELPLTLHQQGSGAQALVSQRSEPLPSTALHDPRLSVGIGVLELPPRSLRAGLGPLTERLDLGIALPLGQKDRLAGHRSPTFAPQLTTTLRFGPGFVAASLGMRWRESVSLAGARFGAAAQATLGGGVDVLGRERLTTSLEVWALPELTSQTRRLPDGSTVGATLVPAEWMVSIRSMPALQGLSVQLGAGTALPLSEERQYDAAGSTTTERFSGATACAFRLVLVARYAPPFSILL